MTRRNKPAPDFRDLARSIAVRRAVFPANGGFRMAAIRGFVSPTAREAAE